MIRKTKSNSDIELELQTRIHYRTTYNMQREHEFRLHSDDACQMDASEIVRSGFCCRPTLEYPMHVLCDRPKPAPEMPGCHRVNRRAPAACPRRPFSVILPASELLRR